MFYIIVLLKKQLKIILYHTSMIYGFTVIHSLQNQMTKIPKKRLDKTRWVFVISFILQGYFFLFSPFHDLLSLIFFMCWFREKQKKKRRPFLQISLIILTRLIKMMTKKRFDFAFQKILINNLNLKLYNINFVIIEPDILFWDSPRANWSIAEEVGLAMAVLQ